MPDFTFRIRFNRSPHTFIQEDEAEIALSIEPPVELKSRGGSPIKEADRLSITSSGYESEEQAKSAARRCLDVLMVTLARTRVGVDFGDRASRGVFTEEGLARASGESGATILNDIHGLMIYLTDPKPKFVSMEAKVARGVTIQAFRDVFARVMSRSPSLSEHEKIAFSLFNAALFQDSTDTRFLLLVMAVEVLLQPKRRSEGTCRHLDALITETQSNDSLSDSEKNSLASSLGSLKSESIGQAGRSFVAERLPQKHFNQLSASKFFAHCYGLRSNLVHGSVPLPAHSEIAAATAGLETMVSDLLTDPYLG